MQGQWQALGKGVIPGDLESWVWIVNLSRWEFWATVAAVLVLTFCLGHLTRRQDPPEESG